MFLCVFIAMLNKEEEFRKGLKGIIFINLSSWIAL